MIIAGARGFGVEVGDIAQAAGFEVVAMIEGFDPDRSTSGGAELPIVWVDQQASFEPDLPAVVGVAALERRRPLVERLQSEGRRFVTVCHPSAVVSGRAMLEEGCVVFPNAVVGARTRIGAGTVVNRGALVGHHTTIGRYGFLGPGANVAGMVTIGDNVTIAMAAVVRDGLTIGESAIVGAGAVAVTDVPPHTTVVGVPARAVDASDD